MSRITNENKTKSRWLLQESFIETMPSWYIFNTCYHVVYSSDARCLSFEWNTSEYVFHFVLLKVFERLRRIFEMKQHGNIEKCAEVIAENGRDGERDHDKMHHSKDKKTNAFFNWENSRGSDSFCVYTTHCHLKWHILHIKPALHFSTILYSVNLRTSLRGTSEMNICRITEPTVAFSMGFLRNQNKI